MLIVCSLCHHYFRIFSSFVYFPTFSALCVMLLFFTIHSIHPFIHFFVKYNLKIEIQNYNRSYCIPNQTSFPNSLIVYCYCCLQILWYNLKTAGDTLVISLILIALRSWCRMCLCERESLACFYVQNVYTIRKYGNNVH